MSISEGAIRDLTAIREAAEKVVEGMPDGPMKVKAFEMAFLRLQDAGTEGASKKRRSRSKAGGGRKEKEPTPKRRRSSSGPQGHLRELIEEGFFDDWRSIPEIQEQLRTRGHNYEQEDLSKPLIRLTRAKALRRERRQREGQRNMWAYQTFGE